MRGCLAQRIVRPAFTCTATGYVTAGISSRRVQGGARGDGQTARPRPAFLRSCRSCRPEAVGPGMQAHWRCQEHCCTRRLDLPTRTEDTAKWEARNLVRLTHSLTRLLERGRRGEGSGTLAASMPGLGYARARRDSEDVRRTAHNPATANSGAAGHTGQVAVEGAPRGDTSPSVN